MENAARAIAVVCKYLPSWQQRTAADTLTKHYARCLKWHAKVLRLRGERDRLLRQLAGADSSLYFTADQWPRDADERLTRHLTHGRSKLQARKPAMLDAELVCAKAVGTLRAVRPQALADEWAGDDYRAEPALSEGMPDALDVLGMLPLISVTTHGFVGDRRAYFRVLWKAGSDTFVLVDVRGTWMSEEFVCTTSPDDDGKAQRGNSSDQETP